LWLKKGSRFTVKFSIEGEDEIAEGSNSKWFSPTDKKVTWKKAKEICKENGGRLPTIDELKKVLTDCGGEATNELIGKVATKNVKNSSYQSCYKSQGFRSISYWSSTSVVGSEYNAWIVLFGNGIVDDHAKDAINFVRCVRDGQ